jgi:hypothetical protein
MPAIYAMTTRQPWAYVELVDRSVAVEQIDSLPYLRANFFAAVRFC